MPRSQRSDIANAVHHVTQRGLERRNIVLNEDDRSHWWRLFERVARRCQWRVFAVALLDNHFHIFLRTPQPNLSDGMQDLDGGYASFFNQRHDREGPLFQGRFKSVPVEHESHSWELSRYVHLNPYRAKLTTNPLLYRLEQLSPLPRQHTRPRLARLASGACRIRGNRSGGTSRVQAVCRSRNASAAAESSSGQIANRRLGESGVHR